MAAAAPQAAALPDEERWRPRTVRRLGPWRCGDIALKAYAILGAPGPAPDAASVAAAEECIKGSAPSVSATPHRGAGFAILHHAEEDIRLLLHWWLASGSLAGLAFHASHSASPRFERLATSCPLRVWELALLDHERRAWIRTGMAPQAVGPAYFDDLYRQDFC